MNQKHQHAVWVSFLRLNLHFGSLSKVLLTKPVPPIQLLMAGTKQKYRKSDDFSAIFSERGELLLVEETAKCDAEGFTKSRNGLIRGQIRNWMA